MASLSDQADLGGFLTTCVAGGGEVLQVTPHKETLEALFIQEAAKGASA